MMDLETAKSTIQEDEERRRKGREARFAELRKRTARPEVMDHNLQDCALCLKALLPEVFDRKMQAIAEARAQGKKLVPKNHVKTRGKGLPFARRSQPSISASTVGAF